MQIAFWLTTLALVNGCRPGSETNQDALKPEAVDGLASDAYAAARIMVGKSMVSPSTTRISVLDDQSSTGAARQPDNTWKTWGWLEMTDADGRVDHEEWRAVMRLLEGEGRRWHALWLQVGDQQSGDPTTWVRDVDP